jgi:hypothetical protein
MSALPVSERSGDPPLRTTDDLRWLARHWAARIGVRLTQIHVRSMRSKWASMSTSGRLTLNVELLALPRPLAEYVVVHELVHLLVANHGKVFKSFLFAYLPDWRDRDSALRTFDIVAINRMAPSPAGSPSPEHRERGPGRVWARPAGRS